MPPPKRAPFFRELSKFRWGDASDGRSLAPKENARQDLRFRSKRASRLFARARSLSSGQPAHNGLCRSIAIVSPPSSQKSSRKQELIDRLSRACPQRMIWSTFGRRAAIDMWTSARFAVFTPSTLAGSKRYCNVQSPLGEGCSKIISWASGIQERLVRRELHGYLDTLILLMA